MPLKSPISVVFMPYETASVLPVPLAAVPPVTIPVTFAPRRLIRLLFVTAPHPPVTELTAA